MSAALAARPTEMSPAKKAWETRRLRASARVDIEARKRPVAIEASPNTEAKMVELCLGDPPGTQKAKSPIGTGFRRLIVIEVGTKTAKLFSVPYLTNITIDRATFDRKAKPVTFNPKTVKRIIRENIELTRRIALEPGEGARRIAAGKTELKILKAGRA